MTSLRREKQQLASLELYRRKGKTENVSYVQATTQQVEQGQTLAAAVAAAAAAASEPHVFTHLRDVDERWKNRRIDLAFLAQRDL